MGHTCDIQVVGTHIAKKKKVRYQHRSRYNSQGQNCGLSTGHVTEVKVPDTNLEGHNTQIWTPIQAGRSRSKTHSWIHRQGGQDKFIIRSARSQGV
jgi:hypothetical protein